MPAKHPSPMNFSVRSWTLIRRKKSQTLRDLTVISQNMFRKHKQLVS